jgi:hypothetical protein
MNAVRIRDDSGQVAPLLAVCMLGLLAVAGLVIDGGVLFSARRDLQSLADGAARSGAMAVDEQTLRDSGGSRIYLNPGDAELAVTDYLNLVGFDGSSETTASADSVRVTLHKNHRTVLLSIVGIRTVETRASSTAGPRSAMAGPGG